MTDSIEHNGGPQPVANGTWVRRFYRNYPGEPFRSGPQLTGPHDNWKDVREYEVLNQHLIDAARLEGIRLGLDAAANETERMALLYSYGPERAVCHKASDQILSALNPETIAREAQDMGSEKEAKDD